jgi:hypothetical protein
MLQSFVRAETQLLQSFVFLRRQEKVNKKKATPVCRATLQVADPR